MSDLVRSTLGLSPPDPLKSLRNKVRQDVLASLPPSKKPDSEPPPVEQKYVTPFLVVCLDGEDPETEMFSSVRDMALRIGELDGGEVAAVPVYGCPLKLTPFIDSVGSRAVVLPDGELVWCSRGHSQLSVDGVEPQDGYYLGRSLDLSAPDPIDDEDDFDSMYDDEYDED